MRGSLIQRGLGYPAALDAQDPPIWHTWLILILVLAAIAYPFQWTGNEEQYFPLALRTAAPDQFGPWSAAFDSGRERIVGFWLIGTVIKTLGYEPAHLLLSFISIGLLSWGIARLGQWLSLSILDCAIVAILFWLAGEALLGGEWMFDGVEPKTLAHGCGLIAFAGVMQGRWRTPALWMALGLYFHFLAAGYWLAAAILLGVVLGQRAATLRFALATLALTIPLLALLVMGQIQARSVVQPPDLPPADYIYSILRIPHHAAPFDPTNGLLRQTKISMVYTLLIAAWAAFLGLRHVDPKLRGLAILILATSAYLYLAILLAWLDRHTGHLGKLYLLRPASPYLLLSIFGAAAAMRPETVSRPIIRWLPASVIGVIFAVHCVIDKPTKQEPPLDTPTAQLVAAMRAYVPKDAPILLDPALERYPRIPRESNRQTIVQWKFLPSASADTYRWYRLILEQRDAFKGRCDRIPAAARYLAATQATQSLVAKCGYPVWSNSSYKIIRLR